MQKYCILLCFERVSAKAMILDGLLGFPFEVEILEKPMVFSGLSVAGSSFLMKASSSQVPLPTSNFLGGRTRRPDQVVEPGGRTRERGSPACTLMVTSQHHSLSNLGPTRGPWTNTCRNEMSRAGTLHFDMWAHISGIVGLPAFSCLLCSSCSLK